MKSRVSFQLIVFQDDYILEQVLKTILPFGNVYVAEGPVAHFAKQGYTTSTDRTNEILHDYLPEYFIKHGVWQEKDEMVNAALSLMPQDTNFVWQIDADELYRPEDLETIIKLLDTDGYDSMSFRFNTFYGGFERYITGFEYDFENHRIQRYYPGCKWMTHRPPTIIAPDGKAWREHRHLNHVATSQMGIEIMHYSYVWPEQMKRKTEYYAAMGGNIPDYFNQVYLPWVLGDRDARNQIEMQYHGVHNWSPGYRTNAYTAPFLKEHPVEIQKVLPQLKARFAEELAKYD